MSQLPPQAITEFQALWKKHCGQELSREEAALRAHQVFAVLRLLWKSRENANPNINEKPSNED